VKAASDPWEESRQVETKLAMKTLRRTMMKLLAEHGVERELEPAMPAVRTIAEELVRGEFFANTAADGTDRQKRDVKRKRFNRTLARAENLNLIGRRDIEGRAYLWFIQPTEPQGPEENLST